MRVIFKLLILLMILGGASTSFTAETKVEEKTKEELKVEKKMRRYQKAMWIAHVLREKKDEKRMKGLGIGLLKVPVFLVPQAESFRPLVKLVFQFDRQDWTLLDSDGAEVRKVKNKENEYIIYAYLNARVSTVKLSAVGPEKAEEKETLYLFAPEAREFKTVSVFDSVQYYFGHTYLEYNQKSSGRYVSQSLLLGVKYLSPEKGRKFGYLADASSTVYTYSSSPLKNTSNFIEARAALTYKVKLLKDPKYRTRLSAGLGTINLISLGSAVGFKGLFGANLGLRTEYYKSGINSYSFGFEYMPYDFTDPISERTLKFTLEWTKNLDNLRLAQLGVSYADHSFTSGVDEITANLFSIYASMSF